MFEAWGRLVYRFRWLVLAVSGVLLVGSVVAVFNGGSLSNGGPQDEQIEAAHASNLINTELQKTQTRTPGSNFLVILSSSTLKTTDPEFQAAVTDALQPLSSDARVTTVTTPYNAGGPSVASAMISRDGHRALAIVGLKDDPKDSRHYIDQVAGKVHSSQLKILITGSLAINRAFDVTLESDLQRAEFISLPISLLLLLLVFGAVVAALLPVGVGLLSVVGGVAATLILARFTDVSQYAINLVTLIGLGVAIDYSLFIVNRYREELARGRDREAALGVTLATAGRAVTFSGVTVAIGLSALFFYHGTFLASMGGAGALVVVLAVLYALSFLPALLAVLGPRVDLLRVPLPRTGDGGFWRRFAGWVMRRPVLVLVPSLAALVLAGTPFFHLRLANGDVDMLPQRVEARQGYDVLVRDFPGHDQTVMTIVAYYPDGHPLTPDRVGSLYDLSRRVAAMPGVLRVESPLNVDPSLSRADYQRLYSQPVDQLPAEMRDNLALSTGKHIVLLYAYSNHPTSSDAARELVRGIRNDPGLPGGRVLVTGGTASDMDIIGFITQRTPYAVLFAIVVTYLVLFLLTGSLVLPLKAVIMNLLSLAASFGALVWIFQDGHLSNLLGFTPQSIDPTIPVIMFSLIFGLSMDYEVLLVSRIQEEYRLSGDNRQAVAEGLQRSGRLITGAAGIMVAVFLAFGVGEVVYIKAIGLGLAIAVAIDATIVRALVVPAVMRLLGDLNWWAPGPLAWIQRRLSLGDLPLAPEPVEASP
jgi:RND superfamily putative drug exporter